MKRLEIAIAGKPVVVIADRVGSKIWLHHEGLTWDAETSLKKGKARRGGSETAASGGIRAPMPGKVTKLAVGVGDIVRLGQVVVLMEAMKMEYTLKAPYDGKLEKLHCKVGQQVDVDELLAEIKKGEG